MVADTGAQGDAKARATIFVSYSRKDAAFVDRLEAALIARGLAPKIDRKDIYAFEDWRQRIEQLIVKADAIVFVLSPDSVVSEHCAWEAECAASLKKRFAPIVCRKVEAAEIPQEVARLNFIFFDDEAQFEPGADLLAEALLTDIDWVRKHTEYGELARRWSLAGRPGPKGRLLRPPVLEEAERWIAARPEGAPAPTQETQEFVAESRKAETRRRNGWIAGLSAAVILALALLGLAEWQRERAEKTLALATETANGLVFDLAQKFRDALGMSESLKKDILDRARKLQEQLQEGGETSAELRRSQVAGLVETVDGALNRGDVKGALAAARDSVAIMEALTTASPHNTEWRRDLSASYDRVGNILIAQGDLDGAMKAYRNSLERSPINLYHIRTP